MKNTTIFKTSNSGKNLRFWHFCLVLYLLTVTGLKAQTTVTLGSGTTTSTANTTGAGLGPVNAYYEYMHFQVVYTAAEITAAGGSAGAVTQFGWNVSTASPVLPNYKVRMAQTSATDSATNNAATLSEVYSASLTPVAGYNMLTLSSPFIWDGTSNILVDVCYGAAAFTSPYGQVFTYGTAANSSRFSRADGANQCGVTTNLVNAWKPQARFVISPPPSCFPVSGLNVNAITNGGATVTWTAPATAPAMGYDYYLSTTNTAPTSGTTPTGNVATASLPLSSLTSNTPYYIWVRGKCGASDTSSWSTVATFTTACDAQDIPYTQDFESATVPAMPSCTSLQNAGSGNNWTTVNNPGYGFTNKTLRYAWNSSNAANAWFYTKALNLTAGTSYRIAYKYGSGGSAEKLKVAYGTSNVATAMTNVLADHPSITTSPLTNFVDFTPATSGVYYFGFQAYSAANLFWLMVDDISVTLSPTCFAPTAVTAAVVTTTSGTVSWTAPSTAPANGYQYYVSTTNTAPTAGTTPTGSVGAGVLTSPLGGLAANTTYYVWVRSNCTASDQSAWTGPSSFFTGYCTPAPSSVDGTGITNVTMGTINNTTAGETGNYGNYSAISFDATLGSTVNFSIALNSCDAFSCYTYGTKIWIDWNNDLDFTDASELVYTGLSGAVAPIVLSGSFVVPANATFAGTHRMRIGATDTDTGPSSPCYTGTYGSFEDYTINAVMPPAPAITSFTPASYCAATGVITITGTGLGNATVTVGGTPVTPLTTNTATQIVATVPAGVSGVVSVTTIAGTATSATPFSVTAPTSITLSAASDVICVGQSTDVVTIATGAASFDTFAWTPLAGVSGDAAAGYIFNPTATTTYTLTASNTVSGCVTTTTFTVNVNVLPTALVLADSAAICEGGSAVAITATGATTLNTLLSENFNGATNNWTTTNTGTGGTVANAAWTLRADGYTIPGYQLVHSNDNSQFYMSNSDQQGSGSTTSTTLQSPSFSTVGYASATLAFHHFYQHWATGSSGLVQASTDGTTWTTLQTYSANTGAYTAFNAANIALTAPFLNQPVVYVRFKFDAVWGYFWAIDNVSLTGQQGADITWAPQAGLYTDAAATIAYTGQPMATVYAKPTMTTAYTATATNPSGCTVTDAIEVIFTSTPAPTADAAQSVCGGATVTGLTATGTGIKWYAAATGGTQLANTAVLVNGTTYYASQTANGCESMLRTPVTVTINVTAAPTVANDIQSFCNAGTVSQLVATGSNIQWYSAATGGTALAGTTAFQAGTTVYYASQTLNGCESTLRTAVAVVVNVTAAPTAAATQTFCNSGTVAGLMASGSGVQWYAAATGGTALAATTPLTDGGMYYASQTIGGCEGTARTMVMVDFTTPEAPAAPSAQTFCNMAMVSDLAATGNVSWYAAATGGTALSGSTALTTGGMYYASQTVDGCESATRTMVTVTLTTPAAPEADATQSFCNGATVADLSATGEGIMWYASATGGTALSSSTALTNGGVYYASQMMTGCESATRTMVTVAFNTTAAPVAAVLLQAFCNNAVVADLDVEGTNVVWYTSATGGNALADDAELTDGMLYYASQTIDGCESMERTVVAVAIGTVDALTGDADQTITVSDINDATIEDLMVAGLEGYVTWYASEEDALNGENALAAGTQLVSGNTYYAIQTVGQCSSTTAFAVTVDVALGGDHFDIASFKYYPNPVKDVLNVSYSSDITAINVFNMLGQQVISLNPASAQAKVDMSGMADGAYIMKVVSGNAVKTIKIMKKQ